MNLNKHNLRPSDYPYPELYQKPTACSRPCDAAGSRCAPDCTHTDKEHDAFDLGYEHGFECKTDNPFKKSDPPEWSRAYEEGNYAGRLSHREDCLTADEVAMGIHFENKKII